MKINQLFFVMHQRSIRSSDTDFELNRKFNQLKIWKFLSINVQSRGFQKLSQFFMVPLQF
jgi:hypothetical protein